MTQPTNDQKRCAEEVSPLVGGADPGSATMLSRMFLQGADPLFIARMAQNGVRLLAKFVCAPVTGCCGRPLLLRSYSNFLRGGGAKRGTSLLLPVEGLVLTRCDVCGCRQWCAVNGTAMCARCCPGAVEAAREDAVAAAWRGAAQVLAEACEIGLEGGE